MRRPIVAGALRFGKRAAQKLHRRRINFALAVNQQVHSSGNSNKSAITMINRRGPRGGRFGARRRRDSRFVQTQLSYIIKILFAVAALKMY